MKTKAILLAAAVFASILAGCGGGGGTPVFVANILSDQPADGDIEHDPILATFTPTMGPSNVFFGFDFSNPDVPEFRAFLDFPLDGSTGGDIVSKNARITSATLTVFVTQVNSAPVPTLLDLVSYPILGLRGSLDFSSAPLGGVFRAFDFIAADRNNFVAIDVTALMQEAQVQRNLGVINDFQVRFLVDTAAPAVGFVGIDDRPGVTATAPLLTVEYVL